MTHVTILTTTPDIIWWLLGGLAALCTIISVSACILAGRCDRKLTEGCEEDEEARQTIQPGFQSLAR